jgi:hypothetical protein
MAQNLRATKRSVRFHGSAALEIPSRGPALEPVTFIRPQEGKTNMSITTILLIVLVLILIGALPTWGYSSGWGYAPSGILGAVVLVVLILLLLGRI